ISQFQALCTALAATIGTGNIAGVSAAIVIGGPGAVFWMWIAAFLGMMTNSSENVLGIYYRRKNRDQERSGGPMYYLSDGLGGYKGCKHLGKVLSVFFAFSAILASFGIGNMGQVNKIVKNIESAFFANVHAPVLWGTGDSQVTLVALVIGLVLVVIGFLVILGGLKRVALVAERAVPFMAVLYILGSLIICICHLTVLPAAIAAIFKFAFGIKAVAGGAAGTAIATVITQGCKRGVFSNEAGLGSSVMVHSNSNVKEPVQQGLWGIFEVFADTMVVCTMTALVVLTSGRIDLETGMMAAGTNDAVLVAQSFSSIFGIAGGWFVAIAMFLFAFTTVLGWSHYGSKVVEYLFGLKAVKFYRIFFCLLIVSGALLTSSLAWDISDTFNGLMLIPNLIGVVALVPLVRRITKNYVARRLHGQQVEPILSFDPEIQKEAAEAVAKGEY
ncbi:MAG: alanine:cation symporter family protein, partial [Victivallales bacterium]|nr:alanine:cation symporter family protein [Victivallales bacterium]